MPRHKINPEKLIDELASALALVDIDASKQRNISDISDRAARSVLSLLMIVFKNAQEPDVVNEEIRDLKEQVFRLQVEITKLKKSKLRQL